MDAVVALRGRRVRGIRRVWFVVGDDVNTDHGPIEFTFADGTVALLQGGPDGDSLSVTDSAWVDPFTAPLTEANADFVARHGKWAAFDVSTAPGYAAMTASASDHVMEIRSPDDKVIGVELTFRNAVLRAWSDSDEFRVDIVS